MRGFVLMIAAATLVACGKSEFSNMDALALCDNAIKSTSINPKAVEIPHRSGTNQGDEYAFAWSTGGDGVLMPNQFGALVETTVVCKVDGSAERVVHLEIDGRVLSPK